jgi:competence protein ComEA
MFQWIKELLAEFSPRALKATITVIAVVGFGVYVFSSSFSNQLKVTLSKPSSSDTQDVKSPSIYIHVAGAVRKPGIYQLDSGSRVFDAVLLAGGFTNKANQTSVNMARILNDGEQLLVSSGTSNAQVQQESFLISLNQASSSELEDLPGVGPALAGRMVDWRTANGGFKSKEDLLNVAGIGDKLFAAVKDLVTL